LRPYCLHFHMGAMARQYPLQVPATSVAFPDVLNVNVEDYHQVEAFADRIKPEMWSQFSSPVADNTRRVRYLLGRSGARATTA
jgi:hypothetical protein